MRPSSPLPVALFNQGCVVSYCPVASGVGAHVLREGGNAIDAAVATALALAVTFPQAGNLGGGGFLLFAPASGTPRFLDYREVAPQGITPQHFRGPDGRDEAKSTRGALPVGVPGTVAGLAAALAEHGTWSWERVVAPSIELARIGTWLTTRQARYFELFTDLFAEFPSTAKVFMPEGRAPWPGTLFTQPDLARTLERLAKNGPRDFYEGETAAQIVATTRAHGGVMDAGDLASYRPEWRLPLERDFLGRRVIAPSLPSGGSLVLLASLGLFEAEGFSATPLGSFERAVACARTMRVGFALRGALLGDPAFLSHGEVERFRATAERAYAPGDLARLDRELCQAPSPRVGNEQNTTHLCVLDSRGNAVSNTFSLNTMFGSKLVVDGAGFLLNNCLDDFSLAEGVPNWYELIDGTENRLEPRKRPVSSMCPTIFRGADGRPELVIGGSGGPRIPTMIFQIAQAALGDGVSLDEAVRAPRLHHQFSPQEIAVEEAIAPSLKHALVEYVARPDAVAKRVVETPVLGIACALRAGGNVSPGVPHAPTLPHLAAVLDSRFTLV